MLQWRRRPSPPKVTIRSIERSRGSYIVKEPVSNSIGSACVSTAAVVVVVVVVVVDDDGDDDDDNASTAAATTADGDDAILLFTNVVLNIPFDSICW